MIKIVVVDGEDSSQTLEAEPLEVEEDRWGIRIIIRNREDVLLFDISREEFQRLAKMLA